VSTQAWVVLGLGALGIALVVLFVAWRYPEKECWWCRGMAWFYRLSPILGTRVRGACRVCGGSGWRQRRLSRWLGWGADVHRQWRP
jgi:hypothetical protein